MDLAKIRKKLHKKKTFDKETKGRPVQEDSPSTDTTVAEQADKRETTLVEMFCFRVAAEYYALQMGDIQEIIKYRDITSVPRSANFIKGIISLRGKIVPIVDLKERLRVKDNNTEVLQGKKRIVIVKGPKGPIGITIDEIVEVSSFNTEDLKPPPSNISEEDARFITAIVIFKEVPFSVLNVEEVFSF
jgi:purine-binding chemotaxis protein CheW